ncbi:bifunctional alpha,alpha-trehalose-phosphate synthase (UDP-forming)/trehalose-phosphatase [Sporolactobacillus sp. CPB3-1]|uniref:Bifunctional alpha,alpha-trehalose-phosphate synthase (UDP-forming)/trehalose-phosphatase n=1 Tax=Sporolactobacillus mangiferae TaxID=2940498 RepID=A0ABT0MDK0_9BACL|nr:bifunctional alpha,alpha-trehalose-phosphate synthase (UDP-forming)/trehalose-phosphatase [Sporolactobacillus mangiferae]MCL1632943.1 bifunctional alpha,alpha-trehalose-phosphate synthase (UDP-forming)/trehalose-phosphatase [Sporolactobacillus mangiferae]
MSKTILISNRLPVTIKKEGDKPVFQESIGGLATGLKSYQQKSGALWIGWSGVAEESLSEKEQQAIDETLQSDYSCVPVTLTKKDIDDYYYGFSNKTIWPLFHYFINKVHYNARTWEAYEEVNTKFFKVADRLMDDRDTVWIHDYQLMLLPQMIRDKYPNAKIGFFLHIPFPSYELFRTLIWREEILRGMLGADLIGFHTYDYVRHFFSTCTRLLGTSRKIHTVKYEDRQIHVGAFPMGIDYNFFTQHITDAPTEESFKKMASEKTILSIDRLDYTKGIPEKIRSFKRLLVKYPQYRGKVRFNLIVAPSREKVASYEELKQQISELVSSVNGMFGTVDWMPIWFYFQSFSQEELISFYRYSDVLLVTPLRDGMNLVAKEYTAARTDLQGMIVISETAGAASELGEGVIVNPNDYAAVAEGIRTALEMPTDEKKARNKMMQERLKRYNVHFWVNTFLGRLEQLTQIKNAAVPVSLDRDQTQLIRAYQRAKKRIIFLDYDGTLVGFARTPELAHPDLKLKQLLRTLSASPKNTVVIASGRDKESLTQWFSDLNLHMVSSHGLWVLHPGQKWKMTMQLNNEWKKAIYPILQMNTDRMPGSFIEVKDYSLAWHYRLCEPEAIDLWLPSIKANLMNMTGSLNLQILQGKKVLEVKDNRISKGSAVPIFMRNQNYDFILGVGDDRTDEDLFAALPADAFSIKVGPDDTRAAYRLKSWQSVRALLTQMAETEKNADPQIESAQSHL